MKYFKCILILFLTAVFHFIFFIPAFFWASYFGLYSSWGRGISTGLLVYITKDLLIGFHIIFIILNTIYLYLKQRLIDQRVRFYITFAFIAFTYLIYLGEGGFPLFDYFSLLFFQAIPLVAGNIILTRNFDKSEVI